MLIQFSVENFRSYKERAVLSMEASADKDLPDNVASENNERLLKAATIFGANAAGKSNIVSAIQTFKSIIIRGNINNASGHVLNTAENTLELIPNNSFNESILNLNMRCKNLSCNWTGKFKDYKK